MLSHAWLFVTPWTAARQASLFSTISQSLLKLTSIELVMLSNHPILGYPLLPLPSVFPSSRFFSNELSLPTKWPKYWKRSGKECACQCRRPEFDSSPRKTPHAAEQLSLCTTSTEAVLWSLGTTITEPACCSYWSPCALKTVLLNERSHCNEKPEHHK